jgi:NAD(P)-dependent dehydrogenase (short-subunit alcohol dehydrogenase family)
MLAPGATIGILGGGQLGRMIALAAARLGYRCHIFADEEDSPAAQVCNRATVADFYDMAALDAVGSPRANRPCPAPRFSKSLRIDCAKRIFCARSASPRRRTARCMMPPSSKA